jgi:hypothetical protein
LLVNQLLSQQLSEEFSAVAAIEGQQNPESVGTESTRSSWAGLPPQNNQHLACQTAKKRYPSRFLDKPGGTESEATKSDLDAMKSDFLLAPSAMDFLRHQ